MRKQTITRIAIVFTDPESPGWLDHRQSRDESGDERDRQADEEQRRPAGRRQRTCRSRMSDSSDAATNSSPMIATIERRPRRSSRPGSSANSETDSALMNASAPRTRVSGAAVPRPRRVASRSAETEMATKSSPISAPATPALASEEVVNVCWNHRTIFACPASGRASTAQPGMSSEVEPAGPGRGMGAWNTHPFGIAGLICRHR